MVLCELFETRFIALVSNAVCLFNIPEFSSRFFVGGGSLFCGCRVRSNVFSRISFLNQRWPTFQFDKNLVYGSQAQQLSSCREKKFVMRSEYLTWKLQRVFFGLPTQIPNQKKIGEKVQNEKQKAQRSLDLITFTNSRWKKRQLMLHNISPACFFLCFPLGVYNDSNLT